MTGPADAPRAPERSLVLASGSPRRTEILTRAGVPHEVLPADIPEPSLPGEAPADMALRLARAKALAVAERLDGAPARLVLGADTIVVVDERVLGKPRDPAHACQMLGLLTGREHEVITAVAVVDARSGAVWDQAVHSKVRMRSATEHEIEDYVATGEPLDKAGSYGIQGEGGRRFVEQVSGSESNVMGLPLEETVALLAQAAEALGDGSAHA